MTSNAEITHEFTAAQNARDADDIAALLAEYAHFESARLPIAADARANVTQSLTDRLDAHTEYELKTIREFYAGDEGYNESRFTAKKGGKGGKKHYELRTFVQMTGTSDKLEITIEAMEHYYRFPEERYGQAYSEQSVLWTFTRELWNKSMSHFVRSTPTALTNASAPNTTGAKRKADASTGSQRRTPKRVTKNRQTDCSAGRDAE
ncbi:MAG: hypothetical protein EON54_18630 [Alcaligenaceae bacterium]|nr:MAG: hypothetical protein EON54_18630 [Alcaligenaceae bacterium]